MDESPTEVLSKLDQARNSLATGALRDRVEASVGRGKLTLVKEARCAAVIVAVRGGFQEAWSRREEMSSSDYEQLAAAAPHGRRERTPVSYREIDRRQPIETITCTHCRIRPGFGPCPACSGVGVLIPPARGESSEVKDCPACEDGFATCTVCGGSRESVQATVKYVTFKPFDTNHIVGASHAEILGQGYLPPGFPPPTLRIDLEGSTHSAYRGQHGALAREYHGYAFGDAVKQARAFVRRVQAAPNFVIHEMRTFALPYVLATFEGSERSHHALAYVAADGSTSCSIV